MAHYDFFQNKQCEYFPCHEGADPETFSCLFCYCPLYCLGDKCGGSFRYTGSGIKDWSACLRSHRREKYNAICGKMSEVLVLVRRKINQPIGISYYFLSNFFSKDFNCI